MRQALYRLSEEKSSNSIESAFPNLQYKCCIFDKKLRLQDIRENGSCLFHGSTASNKENFFPYKIILK